MARSTADRILDQALALFNAKGVDQVSLREIGEAMGISHGNLRYHYPGKDQVVEALFVRCEHTVDAAIAEVLTEELSPGLIRQLIQAQARHLWEFRFLLDHMVAVCQQFPAVKTGMQRMYRRRQGELQQLLVDMRAQGWLRAELTPACEARLIRQHLMTVDFAPPFLWLYADEIDDEAQFQTYAQMWLDPLLPWLTEAGQQAMGGGSDA